jgi:hypothetical protein
MVSAILGALPLGLLLGIGLGPLRLAGVDYSKWYRNPGEVSESNDRSWIGLMKTAALITGRFVTALVLIAAIVGKISSAVDLWIPAGQFLVPLLRLHAADALGIVAGVVLAQAVVEGTWRLGLRATGQPIQVQLAREPRIRVTVAPMTPTRRLIVCCDGTWNSPNQTRETNVVQLLRVIKPVTSTGITQITYYHQGVGTGNIVDRFLGGGAGIGLSTSVKAAYGFLVDNFQERDEILLFGFSRGAYVVRSLAGLIETVGLLEKEEMFRFDDVWAYYTLPKIDRDAALLTKVAPRRCPAPTISCVGVWDTVGALGVPGTKLCSSTYSFHHTSLGSCVRHAFQALAMDERRGNFQPAIWVRSDLDQTLEQVWFPGVHSDVGGGYVAHGLSDTTLRWMLGKLNEYELLEIDEDRLAIAVNRKDAEPYDLGTLHDSRSLVWKLIACPIPRPVGITDPSTERIHPSARSRAEAMQTRRDPYGRSRRRAWLESLPQGAMAIRPALEGDLTACGTPPGRSYPHLIVAKWTLCAWVINQIFGGE